jgi:hypothetical protein
MVAVQCFDFVKAQNYATNKLLSFRIAVIYPPTSSGTCPLITIGSIESANKPQLLLSDAPVPGVYEVPYSVINSITSSATFAVAGNPVNAFNGAGLLPEMKHVTAADNMAWRNSAGTFPISLTVKLNEPINIKKFHIWNMNWLFGTGLLDYTDRGIKNLDIYISSSTDDLSAVTDFADSRWTKVSATGLTLTRATGSTSYIGEDVAVTNAANARWIAFKGINNFTTTSYAGLSEVKIYKEIVDPGPSTSVNERIISGISVYSEGKKLIVKNLSSSMQVQLFNTQGQLMKNEFAKASDMILNVPSGIYIVRVNGLSLKAVHR